MKYSIFRKGKVGEFAARRLVLCGKLNDFFRLKGNYIKWKCRYPQKRTQMHWKE